MPRRFEKSELRNAKVINQVDRKFVACLIERASNQTTSTEIRNEVDSRTLVLIDQHAADERIRVERFLKELCLGFLHSLNGGDNPAKRVEMRDLSPPVPILLTSHERLRLAGSQEVKHAFSDWGFRFADLSKTAVGKPGDGADDHTNAYAQVLVENIPEVVGDKVNIFLPLSILLILRPSHISPSFYKEMSFATWSKGFWRSWR